MSHFVFIEKIFKDYGIYDPNIYMKIVAILDTYNISVTKKYRKFHREHDVYIMKKIGELMAELKKQLEEIEDYESKIIELNNYIKDLKDEVTNTKSAGQTLIEDLGV